VLRMTAVLRCSSLVEEFSQPSPCPDTDKERDQGKGGQPENQRHIVAVGRWRGLRQGAHGDCSHTEANRASPGIVVRFLTPTASVPRPTVQHGASPLEVTYS
jgi:hypothetical protein